MASAEASLAPRRNIAGHREARTSWQVGNCLGRMIKKLVKSKICVSNLKMNNNPAFYPSFHPENPAPKALLAALSFAPDSKSYSWITRRWENDTPVR
jgi:hypothetical protein